MQTGIKEKISAAPVGKTKSVKQKPLVMAIVGPTAIGKSAYAIGLAKKVNGEIISADSRQVYKGLDIGSGKIAKKEMGDIPHHMLDVAKPSQIFSAHDFKTGAGKHIEDILARGKTPIIVGGTGFYVDTLFGTWNLPDVPPNIALRKKLEKESAEKLFKTVEKIDPARAKMLDPRNKARLIRSIEIAKAIGKVPKITKKKLPYQVVWIGLKSSRDVLRKKIAARTKKQLYQGMIEEVAELHQNGLSWKRLHALGLEQRLCAMYLQGKITKAELEKMLLDKIYQYAIRQMRWFGRNKEIGWVEVK